MKSKASGRRGCTSLSTAARGAARAGAVRSVTRAVAGIAGAVVVLAGLTSEASGQIRDWRTGEVIPGTEGVTIGPRKGFMTLSAPFGDFRAGSLAGLQLWESDVSDARFDGADLTDFRLYYTDARRASFDSARLTGAYFFGIDFTGVSLNNAEIAATFFSSGCTGLTAAQLASTANYRRRELSSVWLYVHQDLRPLDFTGFDLRHSNLSWARVDGLSFAGAEIDGTTLPTFGPPDPDAFDIGGMSAAQLYSTASYGRGRLERTRLSGDLSGLRMAGMNLRSSLFWGDLSGADFSNTDLTGAGLGLGGPPSPTPLPPVPSATLAGAEVRDASFVGLSPGSGLDATALYATRTYLERRLGSVVIANSDLRGFDFRGQDLRGTSLEANDLTGADFTDAAIENATIVGTFENEGVAYGVGPTLAQLAATASFRARSLRGVGFFGIKLDGADLRDFDLTGFRFRGTLYGADLTDADVRGAAFLGVLTGSVADGTAQWEPAISAAQLASTRNYRDKSLGPVTVVFADLSGLNLSRQDLRGAHFEIVTLTGVSFAGADLRESFFGTGGAVPRDVTGLDFTGADLRSAWSLWPLRVPEFPGVDTIVWRNAILETGTVAGLALDPGETWVVRNDDTAVTVTDTLLVATGATVELRFAFERGEQRSGPWLEPITVAGPAVLGGTLVLRWDPTLDPAAYFDQELHLFDWIGDRTGTFAMIETRGLPGGWGFDTSRLYSSGTVTVIPEPAAATACAMLTLLITRRRR